MHKILLIFFFTAIPLHFTLCSSFSLEHPTDRRILVLLDDLAVKSSHSLFFNSLQTRGFELDFKLAGDPKIALQRYGQYLYDGLILFCPTIERFGGSIDAAAILDFVDSGHSLMIAAGTSTSELIREIATESGVDFDEDPAAMVIDHIICVDCLIRLSSEYRFSFRRFIFEVSGVIFFLPFIVECAKS